MQRRPPANQFAAIGLLPEARHQCAQQQHLYSAHARMRRHFESTKLEQAQTTRRTIRRVHFVDGEFGPVGITGEIGKEVAQQTVGEPWQRLIPGELVLLRQLLECNLQLVELSSRASSTRGAWLVGPMNMPEKRYDSDG